MDDISFSCSGCHQTLEAPPEMAGEVCECPNCGQEILIPDAAAESPPIPVSDALAGTEQQDSQGGGNACSECGAEMEPDAVLCLQCGFHKGLGKKIDTDLS